MSLKRNAIYSILILVLGSSCFWLREASVRNLNQLFPSGNLFHVVREGQVFLAHSIGIPFMFVGGSTPTEPKLPPHGFLLRREIPNLKEGFARIYFYFVSPPMKFKASHYVTLDKKKIGYGAAKVAFFIDVLPGKHSLGFVHFRYFSDSWAWESLVVSVKSGDQKYITVDDSRDDFHEVSLETWLNDSFSCEFIKWQEPILLKRSWWSKNVPDW